MFGEFQISPKRLVRLRSISVLRRVVSFHRLRFYNGSFLGNQPTVLGIPQTLLQNLRELVRVFNTFH